MQKFIDKHPAAFLAAVTVIHIAVAAIAIYITVRD